ncbi:hypothetical protein ASD11_16450 [Aeromicrobium sp. Root495]|uniref:hypothetical protein n=1 Tax=Aeromicrobium sp. Root495 TaxID=1736550 RepID=UPI0006FA5A2B|nr:hypothetical protein [Aeromicrobium sp. Root495]KQY56060.1 hypothetical protein ASD11_16450 [Aeromicrobium sp. Root495]
MGLVAFASAKGSPGVTTASLLVGALWPRPTIVVECDPSGGDVALRMPGDDGQPLDPQRGLLSLVAAGRKSLYPGLVPAHAQRLVGGQEVVAGVSSPEQSAGIGQWAQLGELFAELPGSDVMADLGRIGAGTPQNALLTHAAALVMVVDTVPSNVIHLRERLRRVKDQTGGPVGVPVHVAVVAEPKRARAVREVAEALERAELQLAGVHHLAHDVPGAGFFLGQVSGNPDRTHLVRSARPIVQELSERTQPYFVPQVSTQDDSESLLDQEGQA